MPREPWRPHSIKAADPHRFTETKGREIEGLPVREERFTVLQPEIDYDVAEINPQVESAAGLEQFALFVNPTAGSERRLVKPPHWRAVSSEGVSAVVRSRPKAAQQEIGHFYEINTKGAGFLKPTAEGIALDDYDSWISTSHAGTKVLGLVEADNLLPPKNIVSETQLLFERGLRCEVYWAVLQLKRIPFRGQLTTLEQLVARNVIPEQPHGYAQAVRLLKNNDRIAEAAEASTRRNDIFAKAFAVCNQETSDDQLTLPQLDIHNPEHQVQYFTEFFRRMGSNLGVFIEHGMRHYHLHSANITMAAEIVDIESVVRWQMETAFESGTEGYYSGVRELHIKDMRDVVYSLKKLLQAAHKATLQYDDTAHLVEACLSGFDSVITYQTLQQRQQTDPTTVRQWFKAILTTVLIDNKRLPPLNNINTTKPDGTPYNVEDWGIALDMMDKN